MSNIDLPSGKLAGRYRILARGASAGPSTLFEAEALSNQRRVAFEWLRLYAGHPALASDLSSTLRAVRELRHPGVVRVHDAELEARSLFVVTDLLRGEGLSASLAPGRVARAELRRWLLEVMEAVRHAHARELVHGALHPESIRLVASDAGHAARAMVTDFVVGHVAALDRAPEKHALSRAVYCDPERLRGQDELDPRADVYAIAVMTYQALTGRLPAVGSTAALEELPPRLTKALNAALAERRADRPRTLDELSGALSELAPCASAQPSKRATTALWIMPRLDGSAVEKQRIVRVAAPEESAEKRTFFANATSPAARVEPLGSEPVTRASAQRTERSRKHRGLLALAAAPLLMAALWGSADDERRGELPRAERRTGEAAEPMRFDALRESGSRQRVRAEAPLPTPENAGVEMQPGSPEPATTKDVPGARLSDSAAPRSARRPRRASGKGAPSHARDVVLPLFRAGEPPAVDEF